MEVVTWQRGKALLIHTTYGVQAFSITLLKVLPNSTFLGDSMVM